MAVEGADAAPDVLIDQLAARTHERDRLRGELARLAARQAIAAAEVEELIDYVGGLASALRDATDAEKADLYQELGLDLTYEPLAHQLRAELIPGGVHLGVSEGELSIFPLQTVLKLCA